MIKRVWDRVCLEVAIVFVRSRKAWWKQNHRACNEILIRDGKFDREERYFHE